MDFLKIEHRYLKQGGIEVYPKFVIGKCEDIMIRGGDFYAIWLEDRGLWSTDEDDVKRFIDSELVKYTNEKFGANSGNISIAYMWDSDSGSIDRWHRYCQKQQRDFYTALDESLTFANDDTTKKDYASKKLPYKLLDGPTPAWDTLIGTLYTDDERHKIEWSIGSIVTGHSKSLQKFVVLYGAPGSGKGTLINIIQKLFDGYYAMFDAAALGSSSNQFSLEAFKTNPLVAIQHDGDLSKIEDNTRLNSLVSHELMTVNEKFKSAYTNRFLSFLFMGTNKPVKITDGKSGLIRRLIDITPSGYKLNARTYANCNDKVNFELGAIAYRCQEVFLDNPHAYDNYIPTSMLGASNDFYNFMIDSYHIFAHENSTTLKQAWEMYKVYCSEANIAYPLNQRNFKEELKNYFESFEDRFTVDDGSRVRSYYVGFQTSKFEQGDTNVIERKIIPEETPTPNWLRLESVESAFEITCCDCYAQYANDKETPLAAWDKVNTRLSKIDTSRLHYSKVDTINHIVIDLDIKDADGNKNYALNLAAAEQFPPTYAEVSKGGCGLHLHYYYEGDVSMLSRIYDDHIEIKVFTGGLSLRRKFTKCNTLDITTISSGLPLKGDIMVNKDVVATERGLRTTIKKTMHKEVHPHTKSSVSFIHKILNDAKNSGLKYDVRDLKNSVVTFAANSTNNADYCLSLVNDMPFSSDNIDDATNVGNMNNTDELVFFDIEIFPNLFLVEWKIQGEGKPIVRMFNPSANEIEELLKLNLVGFNNRKYDNHMLYAALMGYTVPQLYKLSKNIIEEGVLKYGFAEAYNLSYTDIYDFASAGNKKSLKKLQIEMGIHHKELGLPWNEPVPPELWNLVADYCDNDIISTEAAFTYLAEDFTARKILAELAGMSVNSTTNSLTTRIIFGEDKKPHGQFHYRDMSKPVKSLEPAMFNFLNEMAPDMMSMRHGDAESLLPYFPGYKHEFGKSTYKDFNPKNPDKERRVTGEGGLVYAEKGMYVNAALLDVVSMHPTSVIMECLFGVKFTRAFQQVVYGRVGIKHQAWQDLNDVLDGKLTPFIIEIQKGTMSSDGLANALKTAINSVYGLTSASFDNAFKDPRNIDNIVAKRGALFMVDLKEAVQNLGYTVAHIKTDSIKIPNADSAIIEFVMQFGLKYGYTFEHEATYERMCLVNKAVYIAKYATPEQCMELYGYVPKDCKKKGGQWTATGTQFAVPYVFKRLFSKEDVVFEDYCESFSVDKGALHLDFNETLKDVSDLESKRDKLLAKIKKDSTSDIDRAILRTDVEELEQLIAEGHDLKYVGRVGQFTPVKNNCGGGVLYRVHDNKLYNASGASGYRWLESELIRGTDGESNVDKRFYNSLVDDAVESISQYGDFEWFVSDDPVMILTEEPETPNQINYHPTVDDEVPFA